jgi:hypothetical protein
MNEEFIQAIAEWWSACWGGTLAEEAEKKAVLEELKGKYGQAAYEKAVEEFNAINRASTS